MNVSTVLRQLLSLHWLRPETALWRTFDCLLAEQVPFLGNCADLGCGDGTLSYVMAGGKIAGYDAYSHVGSLSSFHQGADIYNTVADPGEHRGLCDDDLRHRFHYGIDHKDGLISKAKLLGGFYQNTLAHDLNRPLPFPSGSFGTCFSNVFYWLDDLDAILADWNRILSASGKLLLFVPNDTFKEKAWLYFLAPHQGNRRYYNYLDRGYQSLIKHSYRHEQWEELFSRNGFRIAQQVRYLTDPVMDIWNVGTRPLSPLLINMAGQLPPDKRAEAKEQWIEFFMEFFQPIIEGELGREPDEREHAFHFYVLEKNLCA